MEGKSRDLIELLSWNLHEGKEKNSLKPSSRIAENDPGVRNRFVLKGSKRRDSYINQSGSNTVMLCYVFCCVVLCCVVLCCVVLCYVVLCYVVLCCVVLCCVMLCYVVLSCVMLCYVVSCYVMLCYVLSLA